MAKVTKRAVDALKAGDRDAFLWDDQIPGFGARCRPSGAKYYFLKYRTDGRQRWHTIGLHGAPWTPEGARDEATRLMGEVVGGADPSGAKQRRRREGTVSQVADRYLAEHVKVHNKTSTAAEVERIVEKRIKPDLGRLKISSLSRADVKAWHQAMSATPYEANRALAYLSKMLSLAAHDWELRADNPCIGIKRFNEAKRERYFSDEEMKRIGTALADAERTGSEPLGVIHAVRLLAVTGCRLGEILGAKWADIDLSAGTLRLRDAKAGARTVHLGAPAVALLAGLDKSDGFVVHGFEPSEPLSINVTEKAWARIRVTAKVADGRLHDFRHTAGTYAAQSGANAFMVRDLLGHKTLAMTGRYVERAADPMRATADAFSNRVAAAFDAASKEPAEIVSLTKRTA